MLFDTLKRVSISMTSYRYDHRKFMNINVMQTLFALVVLILTSCKEANTYSVDIDQDITAPIIQIKGLNPARVLQHTIYRDA